MPRGNGRARGAGGKLCCLAPGGFGAAVFWADADPVGGKSVASDTHTSSDWGTRFSECCSSSLTTSGWGARLYARTSPTGLGDQFPGAGMEWLAVDPLLR